MLRMLLVLLLGLVAPLAHAGVIGSVEATTRAGSDFQVTGWACSTGVAQSISFHVYVGGGAGSGTYVGNGVANLPSEPAISTSCQTSGVPHRFSITLPQTVRRDHAGSAIYVYGISPSGGNNLLLTDSGRFSVPGPYAARKYSYNASGELCKVVEPETGATLYGYDAAGNLAWSASGLPESTPCGSTDASVAARKATRTYDARSRLLTLTFPDGRGNLTHVYEPNGLPRSVVAHNDGVGAGRVTTIYAHNRRGLLEMETMEVGSISWPIDYGYNALGHLQAKRYNGQLIDYAPNALGQATQVGVYANSASYYPNGALKQFTYGNGIVHTMTQNLRGLPARSWDEHGTTEILDDRYSYDGNANVAAITDGLTGSNGRGNRTMTYDGLNRLTKAQSLLFGDEPTDAAAFRYDALDNLTRLFRNSRPNELGRDWDYFYDGANRLTNIEQHSDGATVVALDYDPQGNLTQKSAGASPNLVFDFDFGNRLRKANRLVWDSGQQQTLAQMVSTYLYDGAGRRVRDFNSGVTGGAAGSKYSQYSQDGQLLVDLDGRTGKTHEYMYLAGSLVAIREIGGSSYTTTYQHTDALGSPVAVTNASKVVLERSEYEPYGKVLAPLPVSDGPGFTGHVLDAATGMNYMQQRYYDPGIGRFLSVDPVTADGSTGGNFNRYWYANNNPYKFVDPDGRAPNQSGATGWNHVYYLLSGMNLRELSSSHAGGSYRYFYTSTYGWVDIHHFAKAAELVHQNNLSSGYVRTLGYGNEAWQWGTEWGNDYRSGFSPEDLPSNEAGINFANSISPELGLAGSFEKWADANGAKNSDEWGLEYSQLPEDDPMLEGGGKVESNPGSTAMNGGIPVFRVEGRLDSKNLGKELDK